MTSDTDHDGHSPSQSPDESGDQENGESVEHQDMEGKTSDQGKGGQQKKSVSNAKDPSRPRRKKARRACYACQRAHLTCGDERPCQRCIKRGLQDACADGVRKKAKYLHDAPPEALLPGGASHYHYINGLRQPQQPQPQQQQQQQQGQQSPTYPITGVNDIYVQQPTSNYPVYGPTTQNQISIPETMMNAPSFAPQQSPLQGQFPGNAGQTQPPPIPNLVPNIPQSAPQDPAGLQSYENGLFDSGDLTQYDFDPTAFNFGNHYGALEFGMLGQISSGAAETPPGENGQNGNNGTNNFPTPGTISTTYSGSPISTQQPYNIFNQDGNVGDWAAPTQSQSNLRQTSTGDNFNLGRGDGTNGRIKQEPPNAFSIGMGPAFESPTTGLSPQQPNPPFDGGNPKANLNSSGSAPNSRPGTGQEPNLNQKPSMPQQFMANAPFISNRRREDPSLIYEKVTQPYSYTTGFHMLIALLKKRFSSQKVLRIAKALASIRPSFIACTKTLDHSDLIFMEKYFQRTLYEYEDFISACGTPTLVCRRTGEIVAAGKEFSILTGWRKDVLLGKEPNLNINAGGSVGQASTGSSSRGGLNTPRVPEGAIDQFHPQPVFIAEVLDDDSAVQFYEDFARLAFGDSKGVITTRCKLLKYKTKEGQNLGEVNEDRLASLKRKRYRFPGKSDIAGEAGIDELADKEGKVECSCCWTVKRDLFDLPMMIVMNFLPCI